MTHRVWLYKLAKYMIVMAPPNPRDPKHPNYAIYQHHINLAMMIMLNGQCFGLGGTYAGMQYLGKGEWWDGALHAMSNWDNNKSSLEVACPLPEEEETETLGNIFKRALNYIVFTHATQNTNIFGLEADQTSMLEVGGQFELLGTDKKIKKIKYQRTVPFRFFTHKQLADSLDEKLVFFNNINHTITSFGDATHWCVHDANYDLRDRVHTDSKAFLNPPLHKKFLNKEEFSKEIINVLGHVIKIRTCSLVDEGKLEQKDAVVDLNSSVGAHIRSLPQYEAVIWVNTMLKSEHSGLGLFTLVKFSSYASCLSRMIKVLIDSEDCGQNVASLLTLISNSMSDALTQTSEYLSAAQDQKEKNALERFWVGADRVFARWPDSRSAILPVTPESKKTIEREARILCSYYENYNEKSSDTELLKTLAEEKDEKEADTANKDSALYVLFNNSPAILNQIFETVLKRNEGFEQVALGYKIYGGKLLGKSISHDLEENICKVLLKTLFWVDHYAKGTNRRLLINKLTEELPYVIKILNGEKHRQSLVAALRLPLDTNCLPGLFTVIEHAPRLIPTVLEAFSQVENGLSQLADILSERELFMVIVDNRTLTSGILTNMFKLAMESLTGLRKMREVFYSIKTNPEICLKLKGKLDRTFYDKYINYAPPAPTVSAPSCRMC